LNRFRAFLFLSCLLVLPVVMVLLASSPARSVQAAPSTTLVINEVFNSNAGGSPNPAANEFFEVYNISNAPIDLSGYAVYNKNGKDSLGGINQPGWNPIIQPGEFRAVPASYLPNGDIGVGTISGNPPTNVGLDTTADYVGLAVDGPSNTPIDAVNWGTLNPNWYGYNIFVNEFISGGAVAPNPPDAKTLQRFPDGRDTNSASDWFLLGATAGRGGCDDPYEDDDTLATAKTLVVNTTQTHRICDLNDVDWVRISMSANVTYTVSTAPLSTNNLSVQIQLFDSSQNPIITGSPSAPNNRGSTISNYRPTVSADYFVQVVPLNGGGGEGNAGIYTISALAVGSTTPTATPGSVTPTPVTGCVDVYEPDNSLAQARPIGLNTEQAHIICPAADQDWVRADVGTGKVYHWYSKDLAASLDTEMYLFASDGGRLAYNDDAPGRGLGSQIDYTFSSATTVYVMVRDKTRGGGNGYSYTFGFSADPGPLTGTPTASPTITVTPAPTQPACLDAYEGDGAYTDARLLLINDAPQHRSFCPAGDADWLKFFAARGKAYTIKTLNPATGPAAGVDTYVYLFNSDGQTLIDQNDDGGDGVNSAIQFFPQRDDYYYVQIKNKGDIGGNNQLYDIQIMVQPGVPIQPGTATPIIAPIVTTSPAPPTQAVAPTQVLPPTQAPPGATPVPPTAAPPVATTAPPPVAPPTETPPSQEPPPPGDVTATPEPPVLLPPTGNNPGSPNLVNLPVVVYVDMNRNGRFDAGEGVRNLGLVFRTADGTTETSARTGRSGSSQVLLLRSVTQRLTIPFLGRTFEIVPGHGNLLLGLPAPRLPARIP
jgi:hypothetical protein